MVSTKPGAIHLAQAVLANSEWSNSVPAMASIPRGPESAHTFTVPPAIAYAIEAAALRPYKRILFYRSTRVLGGEP